MVDIVELCGDYEYARKRMEESSDVVLYRDQFERDWKKLLRTGDGVENQDVAFRWCYSYHSHFSCKAPQSLCQ